MRKWPPIYLSTSTCVVKEYVLNLCNATSALSATKDECPLPLGPSSAGAPEQMTSNSSRSVTCTETTLHCMPGPLHACFPTTAQSNLCYNPWFINAFTSPELSSHNSMRGSWFQRDCEFLIEVQSVKRGKYAEQIFSSNLLCPRAEGASNQRTIN